jgi:hypothetical protein
MPLELSQITEGVTGQVFCLWQDDDASAGSWGPSSVNRRVSNLSGIWFETQRQGLHDRHGFETRLGGPIATAPCSGTTSPVPLQETSRYRVPCDRRPSFCAQSLGDRGW